jgi:hypothetical protein
MCKGHARITDFNPSKAELNPICHLLTLLGAHHILHVSRIRANVDNNNDYDDYAHSVSKTRKLDVILKKNFCMRERQELLLS